MKQGRDSPAAAPQPGVSVMSTGGDRRRLVVLTLILGVVLAAYPLTAPLRRLPPKARLAQRPAPRAAQGAAASVPGSEAISGRAAASVPKHAAAPVLTMKELRARIAAAEKRPPSDLDGLLYLAYLEIHAGENTQALQHLEQAAHRYPKNDRPLIALSQLMTVVDAKDRAMDALQRAAQVDPQDSLPHIYLSTLYTDLGWSQAAVREAQEAVRVAPKDPASTITLAQATYDAALWSQAVVATRRAVQLSPRDYHLWLLLGQVYSELGMKQFEDASQALQRALQLNAAAPTVLGALGNLERDWIRPGHLERAENYYRRELKLDPDSVNAVRGLASCYSEKGEVKQAIHLLEKKLQSHSARSIPPGLKFQLGQLYLRDGQIARGRPIVEAYQKRSASTEDARADQIAGVRIAIAPQDTASYYRMGMVLVRLGMADSAIVDLREALRREPANKIYRAALVKALLTQGRTSDARRIAHGLHLEDITEIHPA